MSKPERSKGVFRNAGVEAMGEAGPRESSKASDAPPQPSLGQPPKCPQCGSEKTWKDGLRYLNGGRRVQRYLCRSCGFRFSESTLNHEVKFNVLGQRLKEPNSGENLLEPNILEGELPIEPAPENSPLKIGKDIASHMPSKQTITEKTLYTFTDYNRECRVCASEGGAKNSAGKATALTGEEKAVAEKRAAGATELSQADVEGKLAEFAWWMKKQGYADETIRGRVKLLKVLVKRGANLHDPESVKGVIARQSWSERRKELAVDAYTSFLKMVGGAWKPPRYRKVKTLPFIPTERELDLLIAACNKKTSTFLQLLKETGMRCGEAWRLRWEDVDVERRAICVTPEKGSEARVLKISEELAEMLGNLPRLGDRVFTGSLIGFRRNFQKQRARAARKLENPRILKIAFHTFRHWKATVEYHRTKDIIHVMKLLGHRNINNTLVYITLEEALFQGGSDEFYSAVARSVEEARKLIEAGFEYVCDFDGIKLFRKRK